jgi:hypothetical protein
MLSSDSLETGTGSSNSLRSAKQSSLVGVLQKDWRICRVCGASWVSNPRDCQRSERHQFERWRSGAEGWVDVGPGTATRSLRSARRAAHCGASLCGVARGTFVCFSHRGRGDKVNILKMDHPSGDTMREARRGGLGTSARYRFSSENRNSSSRIDCSSASIVGRCSSGHDSIRANPPSSKCELNSLSGSANSSAECFCAVARVAEALRHSAPLKKSSHDLSC